ncbi:hypothetical protein Nepgr_019150 [Nepenthes gracilis]|uniref:Uncharacterized protein n=1 Tax=Nepenthes gracilis TaxID=150966 RepID=A0AAD3XUR0_NEPGR|nr:hypothetical protein Nepgr_019150 [Nepenthes gracilis]
MEVAIGRTLSLHLLLLFFSVIIQVQFQECHGQQTYVNNNQLKCNTNYSNTDGFLCNGPLSNCTAYLTFRSSPPKYNTPLSIAYLLNANSSAIAQLNGISSLVSTIPSGDLVIIPINCSCTSARSYYQYNATYTLSAGDTYFSVANNTYEALTTCQAMMSQNPYGVRNLSEGLDLLVPLMCACPTSNQTKSGVEYLLTYLVKQGDTVDSIGNMFGVDKQSILDANELSGGFIYYFTPLLVPLKSVPTNVSTSPPPPPPAQSPQTVTTPSTGGSSSKKKWVFVVIGVGALLLLLALSSFLVWRFHRRAPRKPAPEKGGGAGVGKEEPADYTALASGSKDETSNSWSISSEGLRHAIESLTVYKFEDLQKATESFTEDRRIMGSVFRGSFKGDDAAIKILKGDVSSEINILKRVNHSRIIRLSGFCLHDGNTYLVYEYAEKGSLRDWLYSNDTKKDQSETLVLGWKQRVQIAYDAADALNYLHNYANPPCIHKNLTSGNVLLDANFRAKITNFGLARSVEDGDSGDGLHLTRHVVGTQGYMAPEYLENGVITPKLDVFAFGMIMLELLSGRVAATASSNGDDNDRRGTNNEVLSASSIKQVFEGENVRDKLRSFMDFALDHDYPLELAYSMAQLANSCVDHEMNSRPAISEVLTALSKIHSSSLDWDPSDELDRTSSISVQVSC